jgi:hypothetical protein
MFIPDLGSKNKGGKNFLVAKNITKLKTIVFLSR